IVNTCQSTPEFLGPAFDEVVQQAANTLLPGLTAQVTNELCQNGVRGNSDQPPTINTWLERLPSYKFEGDGLSWWKDFKQAKGGEAYVATLSWKDFREIFLQYFPMSEQQKYEREYHTIRQGEDELTKFTDVAQVANTGRNIELLYERGSSNNKRNRDGDRIQPAARNNNQKRYDQRRSDGHGYDRQTIIRGISVRGEMMVGVMTGKVKGYIDYAFSPPCDTCGKLHPGRACHKINGACFSYGLTGHMAKDCLKNGGSGSKGNGNDKKLVAKGKVFSLTRD
nr:hypothetical protein [Tanacetum cinerariifolium]